jgi:hypothetical protein
VTMNARDDGSRYPDDIEQSRVLADLSDPNAETGAGYRYNVALGDLIVQVLAGRELYDGVSGEHEDWESFEHVMMERVALELRAFNQALATDLTTDDHPSDGFTAEQACEFVRGLAARVEAGVELARRLRKARWGHPSFGGGEAFLERKRAEFLAEGHGKGSGQS